MIFRFSKIYEIGRFVPLVDDISIRKSTVFFPVFWDLLYHKVHSFSTKIYRVLP
jgi:hypothetical protein